MEERLAGIWSHLLNLDSLGIDDSFFELGGHSLLVTRMISEVRKSFSIEMPLRSMFESPTIAGFAKRVEEAKRLNKGLRLPPIEHEADRSNLPLSFSQRRLWFLDRLEGESSFYNIPLVVKLSGALDEQALEKGINALVERHEALRTTFIEKDGDAVQVIAPELKITLEKQDLSGYSGKGVMEAISQYIAQPFDLEKGPVFRAGLVKTGDDGHILAIAVHHIVFDGWSRGIFIEELISLYRGIKAGQASILTELPVQYGDYALWQNKWFDGELKEEMLSYWRDKLGGELPALELPTDRPRPAVQTYNGDVVHIALTRELSEALRRLSREKEATLFMTMLAAFKALLYRYTGQEDIIVGTPIAGRNYSETEGMIGFFVNTLALRTDLSGAPEFQELLQRVRTCTLDAYENQEMPFDKLVEELQPDRDMSRQPVFQVMFILQNTPVKEAKVAGMELKPVEVESKTSKFDLTLELYEDADGIKGWIEYNTDLFEAERIGRMAACYTRLLEGAVKNSSTRIDKIEILDEKEYGKVVKEWNNTGKDYGTAACIHEIFEKLAGEMPQKEAVCCRGEALTYGELNRRANRLARFIQKKGLGEKSIVGVCTQRSIGAIVGILAALKAGGAYMPLDPGYPEERIRYMIEDSGAGIIISEDRYADLLGDFKGEKVLMDRDWDKISEEAGDNLGIRVKPESPAYVIYTSGSTGLPKGVIGVNSAAMNRFNWMWEKYPFTEGEVCCQKTSLNFVDSVWEIFGSLLKGVRSIIIPDEELKDTYRFIEVLEKEKVSRIVLVPSLLNAILDMDKNIGQRLRGLKLWVVSGETLSTGLVERFRESMPENRLLNLYGSSEVSADVTYYDTGEYSEGMKSIPIGRPIPNTRIYILDSGMNPVPPGVNGEIYVGGDGLAQGYLNRPELTKEKFIPDPFETEKEGRLFRTGDIGRYLPDGNILYIGRKDNQVKVRGYRIELGEIEDALKGCPGIKEAAADVYEDGAGGRGLVAYMVQEKESGGTEEIREFLKGKLPEYMLPSIYVPLEEMPLNANGKIDRRALKKVIIAGELNRQFVAPETATELMLSELWCEILGFEKISIEDSFFVIGGHSLLATRLLAKIRNSIQVDITLKEFFLHSTIKALAQIVEEKLLNTLNLDDISRLIEDEGNKN